jgi:hypothetical protein
MSDKKIIMLIFLPLILFLIPLPASAIMNVYSKNLAGFNTAAGNPPITIDFDGIASETDITGSTIAGVTFLGPGAPLIVVPGNDTVTPSGVFSGTIDISKNKLFPTTSPNVLSPGGLVLGPGPNNAIEKDDLTLVFGSPVSAFGFDHLSQSADGAGYTSVQVLDASSSILFSGSIPISNLGGGGAPGGADFWGIVSDSSNIKKIVFTEMDNNAVYPDANIGYDTFRFFPTNAPVPSVPEPSTFLLLGAGLGGLALWRRRK